MPVYDLSYKTWEGERRGPLWRWLAIPKFAYMEFINRRAFIAFFVIAWLQFLLRVVYQYVCVNEQFLKMVGFPVGDLVPIGPFYIKSIINSQAPFCFLFAFMLGAGLISRDLAHNSATLILSKPIGRWEYFLGKFSTLFLLFMLLMWFQAIVLLFLNYIITPQHNVWHQVFWKEHAWMAGAATLYSLVIATTLTLLILTASSLTKNARFAGMFFAIYIVGSAIVAKILHEMGVGDNMLAFSPMISVSQVGLKFFRMDLAHGVSLNACVASVIVHWIACGLILKWKLSSAARYGR